MSETLNTIVKTGGDFITRAASGGSIASGVTGTILTLTPPAGQRVRLTHLSVSTADFVQSGISVAIDGNVLISEKELSGSNPESDTRFSVGSFQAYPAGTPPSGNHRAFTGGVNEALTVLKNTGNTTDTIYYGYEFGL